MLANFKIQKRNLWILNLVFKNCCTGTCFTLSLKISHGGRRRFQQTVPVQHGLSFDMPMYAWQLLLVVLISMCFISSLATSIKCVTVRKFVHWGGGTEKQNLKSENYLCFLHQAVKSQPQLHKPFVQGFSSSKLPQLRWQKINRSTQKEAISSMRTNEGRKIKLTKNSYSHPLC